MKLSSQVLNITMEWNKILNTVNFSKDLVSKYFIVIIETVKFCGVFSIFDIFFISKC
jgi:hypothetical protein